MEAGIRARGHWHAGVLLLVLLLTAASVVAGERVGRAIDFLLEAQLEDGLFRYRHDFIDGRDSRRNNIVRQAGAAYALGEYLDGGSDPRVEAALRRALAALDRRSIPWRDGRLVSLDGTTAGAKTGATALALLALLQGGLTGPEMQRRLDAWLRGLLALQRADGGFRSRPGVERASPYSDGEAWLALASYHRRHPLDDRVALALQQADRGLMERYRRNPGIGFFHWGVMAAAVRYHTTGEARFRRFAADQMRFFLDSLRPRVNPRSNSCYSVEGLVAGAGVLAAGGDDELLDRVRERVAAEMEKNLALQLRPGQDRIVFGQGRYLVAPELPRYRGGFLDGAHRPQLRIDSTQHCLSALLKLERGGIPGRRGAPASSPVRGIPEPTAALQHLPGGVGEHAMAVDDHAELP